jgi:hypothetical protein
MQQEKLKIKQDEFVWRGNRIELAGEKSMQMLFTMFCPAIRLLRRTYTYNVNFGNLSNAPYNDCYGKSARLQD